MNIANALRISRDEHAALAAVLRSLTLLVRDARRRNPRPSSARRSDLTNTRKETP